MTHVSRFLLSSFRNHHGLRQLVCRSAFEMVGLAMPSLISAYYNVVFVAQRKTPSTAFHFPGCFVLCGHRRAKLTTSAAREALVVASTSLEMYPFSGAFPLSVEWFSRIWIRQSSSKPSSSLSPSSASVVSLSLSPLRLSWSSSMNKCESTDTSLMLSFERHLFPLLS